MINLHGLHGLLCTLSTSRQLATLYRLLHRLHWLPYIQAVVTLNDDPEAKTQFLTILRKTEKKHGKRQNIPLVLSRHSQFITIETTENELYADLEELLTSLLINSTFTVYGGFLRNILVSQSPPKMSTDTRRNLDYTLTLISTREQQQEKNYLLSTFPIWGTTTYRSEFQRVRLR